MLGQVYGSHRITGKLAEGGMGAVYEAEHIHTGRKAAIKILLPKWTQNKVVVERFFNEARSSALVNHQGIVKIFDCAYADDGNAYLLMELLGGESMTVLLAREGPLTLRRMTSLSRQIAGALAAAHGKGIVHRDLKPDNIQVIPDRDAQTGETVKVLDFGIAKLASAQHHELMMKGVMLGTPLYMSPEQCVSSAEVDGRSDVYSLGCIMFEMLCGRPPFVHDDPAVVANMQVHEVAPRPRSLRPDIPVNIESLILRMLAKDREARPQSMSDLRAELDVVWSLLPSLQRPARVTPASGDPGPEMQQDAAPEPLDIVEDEDAVADEAGSVPEQRGMIMRVAFLAVLAAVAAAALAHFLSPR